MNSPNFLLDLSTNTEIVVVPNPTASIVLSFEILAMVSSPDFSTIFSSGNRLSTLISNLYEVEFPITGANWIFFGKSVFNIGSFQIIILVLKWFIIPS